MIVVVGMPAWSPGMPAGPAGRACAVALAVASRGRGVELVGRVGDDAEGDQLVLALARAGVGHAAVLRDPVRPTPLATLHAEPDEEDGTTGEPAAAGGTTAPSDAAPSASAPRLERADVELGLSYLGSFGVLVVADDAPQEVLPACIEGAAFAGARLVLLVPDGAAVPPGVPAEATVLGVPADADAQGMAGLVGAYVAGLDGGAQPADAFAAALGEPLPTVSPRTTS